MPDCKSVDAPMEPNVKLLPNKGKSCLGAYRYKRLVGKINYLTMAKRVCCESISKLGL